MSLQLVSGDEIVVCHPGRTERAKSPDKKVRSPHNIKSVSAPATIEKNIIFFVICSVVE